MSRWCVCAGALVASWSALAQPGELLTRDAGATIEPRPLDSGVEPAATDGGARVDVEAFVPVSDAPDARSSVEAFEPVASTAPAVESFEAAPEAPTVRPYASLRGDTSVDTRFDSPRGVSLAENVAEARFKTTVGVDVKLSSRVRLVLEGRAQVRLVTQRSFDRAKGFFEPMLGDAFIDVYTAKADVRVGNQRIVMGANAALAPADALNPRDLREGLGSGDPEDATLPVFAVRAQGELGKISWMAAYAPFFTPHRFVLFGQDEGLLQPGLAPAFDSQRIDPSVEDGLQEPLLATKKPVPFSGDVALRVTSQTKVKVGASWVWMNEKLPRVVVDPELNSVMTAQAAGRAPDSATLASLGNRFQAGETLYRGTYSRMHLFSLQASALIGPGQLDVDVTYTPRQTFVDPELHPVDKQAVTWVVGFSQASDSPLVYSLTYLGIAIPGILGSEQLALLEPATAVGASRTGVFHLFMGLVGYPLWHDRFEVQLRGAFEPTQRSFALSPRVVFQGIEGLKVWLAADVMEGPQWSPFGYFTRNDKIVLGARYDLL